MDPRTVLVAFVAVAMVCSLFPIGGVAAESPEDATAGLSVAGVDAPTTDRFRYAVASNGIARSDPDGVLEQPTRKSVYASIRESPGIGIGDLTERVSVTRSTVRYHARVLMTAGLVDSTTVAGTLRLAPSEADAELAGALRAEPTRAMIDAVSEHEPASVTTLSEATDRSPSTVSHHLSSLEADGIVDRNRSGEAVVTTLTSETRAAIESSERLGLADD